MGQRQARNRVGVEDRQALQRLKKHFRGMHRRQRVRPMRPSMNWAGVQERTLSWKA